MACRSARLRPVSDSARPCKTEVGDPDLALAIEHHVGGLEVPVEPPLLVRRRQPCTELFRNVEGLVLGQSPDPSQQRGEVLPVDALHREKVLSVGLPDVPDAADRRVGHLPRHADLSEQPLEPVRVGLEARGQELECHGLFELQVVGAVHLTHPATSQEAQDPISISQHGTRSKPVGGPGGGESAGAGRGLGASTTRGRRSRARRRAGRAVRDVEARAARRTVPARRADGG